jgi:hypothetical protein
MHGGCCETLDAAEQIERTAQSSRSVAGIAPGALTSRHGFGKPPSASPAQDGKIYRCRNIPERQNISLFNAPTAARELLS